MNKKIISTLATVAFLALAIWAAPAAAGPYADFNLDDITHWTGSGANQAGLVVEWAQGGTTKSLAWGYRWDGTAYGSDMLYAIAQAVDKYSLTTLSSGSDSGLFAVIEDWGWGLSVFGLGYDVNGNGFTYVPASDEGGHAADGSDLYKEGWYNGYWSYWVSDGGSSWEYSGWGIAARELSNGSWDGWNFSDFAAMGAGEAPGTPIAAAAPVPVPGAVWLLGSALAGLVGFRRRRFMTQIGTRQPVSP